MTIEEQIRRFVAETFMFSDDGYPLGDDASFLAEGIVDSTGVLELIMFVEETFGITVEDHEVLPEHLDSVALLARFIQRKLALPASETGAVADASSGSVAIER